MAWEEKMSIFEVSEFTILPYTWNLKLGNLGKLSLALNFYRFGCIKYEKDKTFHWISKS